MTSKEHAEEYANAVVADYMETTRKLIQDGRSEEVDEPVRAYALCLSRGESPTEAELAAFNAHIQSIKETAFKTKLKELLEAFAEKNGQKPPVFLHEETMNVVLTEMREMMLPWARALMDGKISNVREDIRAIFQVLLTKRKWDTHTQTGFNIACGKIFTPIYNERRPAGIEPISSMMGTYPIISFRQEFLKVMEAEDADRKADVSPHPLFTGEIPTLPTTTDNERAAFEYAKTEMTAFVERATRNIRAGNWNKVNWFMTGYLKAIHAGETPKPSDEESFKKDWESQFKTFYTVKLSELKDQKKWVNDPTTGSLFKPDSDLYGAVVNHQGDLVKDHIRMFMEGRAIDIPHTKREYIKALMQGLATKQMDADFDRQCAAEFVVIYNAFIRDNPAFKGLPQHPQKAPSLGDMHSSYARQQAFAANRRAVQAVVAANQRQTERNNVNNTTVTVNNTINNNAPTYHYHNNAPQQQPRHDQNSGNWAQDAFNAGRNAGDEGKGIGTAMARGAAVGAKSGLGFAARALLGMLKK